MDEAKKSLIKIFYQELYCGIFLCILEAIAIVFLLVLFIVKFRKLDRKIKMSIIFVILLLVALEVWAVLFTVKYVKDLDFVKSEDFIELEGEMLGFAHSWSDDTDVYYSYPIIKINGTKNTVIIKPEYSVAKTLEIGSQYTFIYLPNTKLAELIQ